MNPVFDGDKTVLEDGVSVSLADNAPLKKGATILDTYKVESDLIETGGMGLVWRVHHIGWDTDLAMKQPRAEFFTTEENKEIFINECTKWIDLGLHPNIVSCYYVREIGGVPTIFAEWMEGGSLADWISDGRLYAGTETEQGERILDIAIQFARGLHYAHELKDESGDKKGLLHRDVKPGNLLLTKDGEAKVSDFGLAQARALLTMPEGKVGILTEFADSEQTLFLASPLFTPVYCSMEQMDGKILTRQTDIYSWAVSVLEMYTGSHPWASGVAAGTNCRGYFNETRVPMPEQMKELLAACLESEPDSRLRDFGTVLTWLAVIYKAVTGSDYPRAESDAAQLTADSLNNRALSFLDLGMKEEAKRCWERAFSIQPHHLGSTYNLSLTRWRNCEIDDIEALQTMQEAVNAGKHDDQGEEFLSQIHLERCDTEAAFKTAEVMSDKSLAQHIEALAGTITPPYCRAIQNNNYDGHGVFITADGSHVVIPAFNNQISQNVCLLEYNTLKNLFTLPKMNYYPMAIDVSDDLNYLLLGSSGLRAGTIEEGIPDHALKLCDRRNGRNVTLLHESEDVISVSLSRDGTRGTSMSCYTYMDTPTSGGTLRVWDIEQGVCVKTLDYPHVRDGAIDDNGQLVYLTGAVNGEPLCLHIDDNKPVVLSNESYERVLLGKGGGYAISANESKITVWELKNAKPIYTCAISGYTCLELGRSGDFVVSGHHSGEVKLWRRLGGRGRCVRTLYANINYTNHLNQICSDRDGKRILANIFSTNVFSWDVPDFSYMAPLMICRIVPLDKQKALEREYAWCIANAEQALKEQRPEDCFRCLEQARAVSGYENAPAIRRLNGCAGRDRHKKEIRAIVHIGKLADDDMGVETVCISRDGGTLLVANSDNRIRLWTVEDGEPLNTLTGHTSEITVLSMSPDGRYLLSGSKDKTLKLWDMRNSKCSHTLTGHKNGIKSAAISPSGRLAISADNDEVKLWSLRFGKCIRTFKSHTIFSHDSFSFLRDLGWRANGCCFVSESKALVGCWDETVKLHSLVTGFCHKTFSGHTHQVFAPIIDPSGRRMLSISADRSMRLWDFKSSECIRVFRGHTGEVTSACFSSDGRYILSGSSDETAKLWSVCDGKCLYTVTGIWAHGGVCFSPDMRFFYTHDENCVFKWEIDWVYE